MTEWNRAAVQLELQNRLWTYLAADAVRTELPGSVEDIWQLRPGELRRLTCAHLATGALAEAMLGAAHRLLRSLPSSLTASEEVRRGSVRGPVAWQRTLLLRHRTTDPALFVCRPPERRYDSPLARLVKLALTSLVRTAEEVSDLVGRGELASRRTANLRAAKELLAHHKLSDVANVGALPSRTLTALRRRQHAEACIAYVEQARAALDDADPRAIADVLATQVLAPATNDVLYELLVGFGVIDSFVAAGFAATRASALRGFRRPFAVLNRGEDETVTIWWQRAVTDLYTQYATTSRYHDILRRATMTRSSLRPDFIVQLEAGRPALLVEVKHTERSDYTPERAGIIDALAYLKDYEAELHGRPLPHALVVAWNATGRPAHGTSVMVSDHRHLDDAINVLLSVHFAAPTPAAGGVAI